MKKIDRAALAKYFQYGFIPAPNSIYKGVKKTLFEDFQLNYTKKLNWNKEKIKQEILKLFKKAVQKELNKTKRPVAILLSGGIDSGMVLAIIREFLPASQIKAFSIGFQEKDYDESNYARLIAHQFGVRHSLNILRPQKALSLMPQITQLMDQPMADPSILPTYYLFNLVKKKTGLAFLGDGGDEALAGYPKYLAHWFLEKSGLGRLPLSLIANIFPGKARTLLRYSSFPLYLRNQLWISPFSPEEVEELTGKKVVLDELERLHQNFKGIDYLDEAFYLDQNFTLPYLYIVKTALASKATGLKLANPFLDKKLFEFCAQIPFVMKLKGFQTKALLKEIALGYLPRNVVFRPKTGFGFPLAAWLKTSLQPLVKKELNPNKIKKQGYLNSNFVEKIVEKGQPQQVWTLLIWQLWLKKHLKN